MNNNLKYEQQLQQFLSFRQQLYSILGKKKSTQLDLIDALSSNHSASSVVELTNNPLFKRTYSNLYKGIKNLSLWEKTGEDNDKNDFNNELYNLVINSIPSNNKRNYHLFGIDVTPNSRQFSPTLTDKNFIHQSNSIKGNKPPSYWSCLFLVILPTRKRK